jgi:hypothetical protein
LGSHSLKWPVGVVFIATNQKLAVGEGCLSYGAPDSPVHTGQSGAPATSPKSLGFDRWSSDTGPALMSGGAPDMNYRLSGAPVPACLTTARFWRALNASQVAVGAEIADASLLHRTVRCTPDSPVNYSEAAEVNSRGWRVPKAALPWSTGHVRCAPDSLVNYSGVASGISRR